MSTKSVSKSFNLLKNTNINWKKELSQWKFTSSGDKKIYIPQTERLFRMFQVDSFCLNNKFLQRGLVNYSEYKRGMRCKLILIWPQVVLWAGSGWSKMFANNSRMFKFQFIVEKIVLKLPKKHTLINWSSKND